jgi:hypothetical protein
MAATTINLIIQIITGIIGGNAAGSGMKNLSLGAAGNTIAGTLGGLGGGIVTISPGKSRLGTFAPPFDSAGNSVKGQLVAKFLSQRLGLDLLVSQPET